jgi:hypothetical protein
MAVKRSIANRRKVAAKSHGHRVTTINVLVGAKKQRETNVQFKHINKNQKMLGEIRSATNRCRSRCCSVA